MSKLKVATILGTRPEIIRLSRVIDALEKYTDHFLVHTGQNYDFELNEVFFQDMGVKTPDFFLEAAGDTLGTTLGSILIKTESVLSEIKPDAVLILGDTNSALAAIMARRMKIPVYHMEAGNRCFDRNVPEETNRRLVDHISDFNLTYTEHARRHLLAEGIHHRRIYVTGSPMKEVLDHYSDRIKASNVVERLGLKDREYFVVSIHREENVDSPERLLSLVDSINHIAELYGYPVILSTHPRTRIRLDLLDGEKLNSKVQEMKPFGFYDYNKLQLSSFCVISDSGTIAEESSILGFPAITPRDSIERPEGLDTGCIIQTGLDKQTILEAIEVVVDQFKFRRESGLPGPLPEEYAIKNTSERVVNLVIGTARLSNEWDGIRKYE